MTEHVFECTSESGHRWALSVSIWKRELIITARCTWQGCEAIIEESSIETKINEYETLKSRLPIKISDGDVWLVFPDAMISLDSILFSKPGPIAERNLRKWRDNILEGKDG